MRFYTYSMLCVILCVCNTSCGQQNSISSTIAQEFVEEIRSDLSTNSQEFVKEIRSDLSTISQEFVEEIRSDLSTISQELLNSKKSNGIVVEHFDIGWKKDEKAIAHFWRAMPADSQPKGIFLYIAGTSILNLESMAEKFAEYGFLFVGLSWGELNTKYSLFCGETKQEILLKAASCALFLANNFIPYDADIPLILMGASNGGIIATLVNELSAAPIAGIIYYMSSGGFTLSGNSQSYMYEAYPGYAKLFDPYYISTKSNKSYAIISTNDMYFPFEHAYPWLRSRTGNNVFIIENDNHQARGIDVDALIMKFIQTINMQEQMNKQYTDPIVSIHDSRIIVNWQDVNVEKILYSLGDKTMYSYFFDISLFYKIHIKESNSMNNTMLLIHGISKDTELPISYFTRISP